MFHRVYELLRLQMTKVSDSSTSISIDFRLTPAFPTSSSIHRLQRSVSCSKRKPFSASVASAKAHINLVYIRQNSTPVFDGCTISTFSEAILCKTGLDWPCIAYVSSRLL
ncbi:hypothetical protein Mapa_003990 [Marchantia paleacea]|nr:hypothetical protein Mapa_003990 [Marchantia paleacea]